MLTTAGAPPAPGSTLPRVPMAAAPVTPMPGIKMGDEPPRGAPAPVPRTGSGNVPIGPTAPRTGPPGPGASVPGLPAPPPAPAPPPPAVGTEIGPAGDAALETWLTDRIATERAAGRSTRAYELQLEQVYGRQRRRPPTVPTPPNTTAAASEATRAASEAAARRRRQAMAGSPRRSPLPAPSAVQAGIRPRLRPRGLEGA